MSQAAPLPNRPAAPLRDQVRRAVIWRSGSQIVAQAIQWAATFLVIRILSPSDYGLFAMTQVVLVLFNMVNGYGLASAFIRQPDITERQVRQLFGMLLLLNGGLALAQLLFAPLAAAYYRQPEVAMLLRVQAVLYLATPFVALPQALLSRGLDFAKQAKANLLSSVAAAAAALAGAVAGLGVWTLVLAPIVLFAVRGFALTRAARSLVWPSFDFGGAGALIRYGGLVAAGQFFVFVQSQADIVIAGRRFDPHALGLYTTSLFLTQIFVSKFLPPLNEVAFSAYARLQDDSAALAAAFLQLARVVVLAAMPFYLGLAATAEPLIAVVLGPQWIAAAPLVRLLALGMPVYTVLCLLGPASDALGRPEISTRNALAGAILLPLLFAFNVRWGTIGLAATWLLAFPLLLTVALVQGLPVIGVQASALARTVAPSALAATAMAAAVVVIDRMLLPLAPVARLATLVTAGGAIYGAWLLLFARDTVAELIGLVRRRG